LRRGRDGQTDGGQAGDDRERAVGRPFRKTFITDINRSFRSNRLALSSHDPLILADQAVRARNEVNLDFHVVRAR